MSEDKTMSRHQKRGPMGGGMRGMGTGEKAKDFKGSIMKLLKYIGSYKYGVAVVMIFAVGSTIFSIFGPKILGKATTEILRVFI